MILVGALLAPVVGAVVGSFATTAGLRWARGEQALSGRSRCDACAVGLGFARTAPIVSYLRQGGACASCGAAIPRVHLAGEVLGAALTLAAWALLPPGAAALAAVLGLTLLAAAVADLACRRLPNLTSAMIAVAGAGLAALRGLPALGAGLVAAALTAGVLIGLRRAFAARKGDPSLGLGDVKLAAALALWLGAATPWAIALAGATGIVQARFAKSADGRIAFGPALAAAGWIVGLTLQAGGFGDFAP